MSGDVRPATPAPACTACGTALEAIAATHAEVTHGIVAVVAVGPVGWRCPAAVPGAADDHDVLAPAADEVAAALADGLVVARRTRLRGTLRCGECDTPFTLPGRRTTRTVTVTGAAPAITLTLDLPMLRCTEDAVDNVPPEAIEDATTAIDRLLGRSS